MSLSSSFCALAWLRVFERLLHHAIVLLVLIVGREILAVFLERSLDGNAVDKEEIRDHRCVFLGVASAVGLDGPVGYAAIVFFPLGGLLVLIGEGPLQQLVGIGERRVGCGGLRGAGKHRRPERRRSREGDGWRIES